MVISPIAETKGCLPSLVSTITAPFRSEADPIEHNPLYPICKSVLSDFFGSIEYPSQFTAKRIEISTYIDTSANLDSPNYRFTLAIGDFPETSALMHLIIEFNSADNSHSAHVQLSTQGDLTAENWMQSTLPLQQALFGCDRPVDMHNWAARLWEFTDGEYKTITRHNEFPFGIDAHKLAESLISHKALIDFPERINITIQPETKNVTAWHSGAYDRSTLSGQYTV